jgi:hypothetical protein
MSGVDPRGEAARGRAEEARRAGAEARASAEGLARAVELAKGMASALDPANARGVAELAWILRQLEGLGPEAQRGSPPHAPGAGRLSSLSGRGRDSRAP